MLAQREVERFQHRSNVRDVVIAEREVVLTYALEVVRKSGLSELLAFKGGTAIRKVHMGSDGRFSMDLDFTYRRPDWIDPEDFISDHLLDPFNEEHWGIRFDLPVEDDSFWIAKDGQSFTVRPRYRHSWRSRPGQFDLQISLRASPILRPRPMQLLEQAYFPQLEFEPESVVCLRFHEILAEKIRACYQRAKVRDLYDLHLLGQQPLAEDRVRRLAVMKIWEDGDTFDSDAFAHGLREARYDWDDLQRLLPSSRRLDRDEIIENVRDRYEFLGRLTPGEEQVAADGSREREFGRVRRWAKRLRSGESGTSRHGIPAD